MDPTKNHSYFRKDQIRIDYDNIDVDDIMSQIKALTEAGGGEGSSPETAEAGTRGEPPPPQHPDGEGGGGLKAKLKTIVLRMMKPFSPLIKFLVLPVHQEAREALRLLDQTNRQMEALFHQQQSSLKALQEEIHSICLRLDRIERAKDYIQLLHGLAHNLVVELTKLKIEEENLKINMRILEKDFDFLKKKEAALEEEVHG